MSKRIFRCIAFAAVAVFIAFGVGASAATGSAEAVGYHSVSYADSICKLAPEATCLPAAIANVGETYHNALPVHRVPGVLEQTVVLGKTRFVRLDRTYADADANGRSRMARATA